MTYAKKPWIVDVTENVLENGYSTGSPARNVFIQTKIPAVDPVISIEMPDHETIL